MKAACSCMCTCMCSSPRQILPLKTSPARAAAPPHASPARAWRDVTWRDAMWPIYAYACRHGDDALRAARVVGPDAGGRACAVPLVAPGQRPWPAWQCARTHSSRRASQGVAAAPCARRLCSGVGQICKRSKSDDGGVELQPANAARIKSVNAVSSADGASWLEVPHGSLCCMLSRRHSRPLESLAAAWPWRSRSQRRWAHAPRRRCNPTGACTLLWASAQAPAMHVLSFLNIAVARIRAELAPGHRRPDRPPCNRRLMLLFLLAACAGGEDICANRLHCRLLGVLRDPRRHPPHAAAHGRADPRVAGGQARGRPGGG